jgi:hypothetical protein
MKVIGKTYWNDGTPVATEDIGTTTGPRNLWVEINVFHEEFVSGLSLSLKR